MASFLIVLVICIAIFFLCREVMCWYFKINEHLENQKKIIEKLDKLDDIERQLKYIDKNTMKKDNL